MLAGLPYVVWPVGSLFILASRKKDDPFLHYHAVQGGLFGAAMLAMCIVALVALGIAFRLLPGSSTYLPGMLGLVVLFGGGTVATLIFFAAIFLGWRATEGEMIRLPLAGDYAEGKMLDHTGMTRREFIDMLEKSFIEPNPNEPEPIPFPAYGAGALSGRAAEVLAQRSVEDASPASLKAAEILAHRQAQQAKAQQAKAEQQAALAAAQQKSNLAAQQAAALLAAQRKSNLAAGAPRPAVQQQPAPPPQQQGRPPAAQPQRPAAAPQPPGASARPSSAQALGASSLPAQPARPSSAQAPLGASSLPAQPADGSRAKSYPLIGGTSGGNVLQPSPPQRSAQPPQKSVSPSGWQQSPGQGQPMPPQQTPAAGGNSSQVKEVDLVRHYKERRNAAQQQSDALRNWLSAVDDA
jgi:uncharacterized membrane protein